MFLAFGLLMTVMIFSHISCGSSGGGTDGDQQQQGDGDITIPRIDELQNVKLTQGVEEEITFTLDLSQSAAAYDNLSINLEDVFNSNAITVARIQPSTIKQLLAIFISDAHAQTGGSILIGVAPASQINSVCSDGPFYGPISVDRINGSVIFDPPKVEAEPQTVSLVGSAPIAICAKVMSPIDVTVNVGAVPIDTSGSCADVSGNWTFSVNNIDSSCGPEEGWSTKVTINQTGCSLDTIWHEETGDLKVPGSVTNETATVGPGDFPDGSGTTTATYTMTVSSEGSMTGNESWTWSNTFNHCSGGTGDLTVTRL